MRHMMDNTLRGMTILIGSGLLLGQGLPAWSGASSSGMTKSTAGEKSGYGHAPRDAGTRKQMLGLNKAFKADRAQLRNDYKAAKRALLLNMKNGEITKEAYVAQKKTLTDQFRKDRAVLRDSHKLKREEIHATLRQDKEEDQADQQEDREAEEGATAPSK